MPPMISVMPRPRTIQAMLTIQVQTENPTMSRQAVKDSRGR